MEDMSSSLKAPNRCLYRVGAYAITYHMAHTIREKKKLLLRVGRIRGQVEAIERALEDEAGCEKVLHLIAGVRGAIAGLMAEVVENHVLTHLVDTEKHPGALNPEAAEQLLEVIRTYLK
jgi:DNA-binding FrmR family transcriptional regulator